MPRYAGLTLGLRYFANGGCFSDFHDRLQARFFLLAGRCLSADDSNDDLARRIVVGNSRRLEVR